MSLFILAGLAACVGACVCLYGASPNQRGLSRPWPAAPARAASAVLLLLGWLGLAHDMQRLSASFFLLTTLMLVLAVLPYLGAFVELRRRP